jgi:hypothetical protein
VEIGQRSEAGFATRMAIGSDRCTFKKDIYKEGAHKKVQRCTPITKKWPGLGKNASKMV